ncbi:MAG: hypothetical protein KJ072_14330 [Verrucomicrobia bacterium]|nr:hypothetical protein [Verrucomicrobiota bacterium]
MRLKLRDNPREWQKFAAVGALFFAIVSGLLWRKSWIPDSALRGILVTLALLLALALVCPAWYRPPYLAAMRFSHAAGQVVGRVLLVLCFVLLVTPLALLLRLLGHDLLRLRRSRDARTYWRPARRPGHHDRSF